ncbi:MAG: ABC transporter ATP-binding protein [Clostridia bacterium]|nr:ABC transporter ATP-binding protein [Clostridia bacterium]
MKKEKDTPVTETETALTPEKETAVEQPTAEEAAADTLADSSAAAAEPSADTKNTPKTRKKRARGKKDDADLTPEEREEREKKKKNKPKDVRQAARRLISYITAYKKQLIIVAIIVILTTAIGAICALIMQPIYGVLENVVEHGETEGAMQTIIKHIALLAVAYITSATFSLVYTRIMLKVTINTITQMRRELFNHLQGLPISYFDEHKVGEIMSRFTSDVGRVSDLISDSFPSLISAIIQGIITVTIMLIYSWEITLALTGALIVIVLIIVGITSICSPLFKKQQKAMGECNGYIEEYIMGIKAVKVFCYEDRSKQRFWELNEEYRKTGVKANIIGGLMGPLIAMVARLNYALAVTIGARFVISHHSGMTVPRLITYLSYASSYGSSSASIAACYSALISALAGAERIFEVLDTPFETDEGKVRLAKVVARAMGYEEIRDGEDAEGQDAITAWKVPDEPEKEYNYFYHYVPVQCNIDIKDVTFAYVEDKDVIKHLTVKVPSGEKVAFVGSTGAGKTTITNLINRFYEIEKGDITIDGISIKDIKKDDLRSTMAFVLQDARLFAGTIRENIRYGKLDATDEEVVAAAKLANAHSFIEKLPEGYDTELRTDGVNLSAGQAQLLNIARAAIAGRPLLVLDEATSSVDTRTERQIERGMDRLMEGKTVLVIAHRLSTVRNSDEILVLENGEVIEQGSHQFLIDLGQKYYQLYTGMFEMT